MTPELTLAIALLIGYILGWLSSLATLVFVEFINPPPTRVVNRRQELIEKVDRLIASQQKVEILFPDPMKEKFDAKTVESISDSID